MAPYTLGGAVSSTLVGGALGATGARLLPAGARPLATTAAIGLALLAASRELGWVKLPVPQLRRQTSDLWAKLLSLPVAATLWGLDLGLLVTTRLTFAGVWVLVVVALRSGGGLSGAVLLLAYWLGRAAWVWVAPLLFEDATSTPDVLTEISNEFRLFQLIHVLGLGLVTVALTASVV